MLIRWLRNFGSRSATHGETPDEVQGVLQLANLGKTNGKTARILSSLANGSTANRPRLIAELQRLRPKASAEQISQAADTMLYLAGHQPQGPILGVRAGGADRLPSIEYRGALTTLFHYTDEAGYNGIVKSGELFDSTGPIHARHGNGQYLTDFAPESIGARTVGELTPAQRAAGMLSGPQVSVMFFNDARLVRKITHFVEIDITGLLIRQAVGRTHQNPLYFIGILAPESHNYTVFDGGNCVHPAETPDFPRVLMRTPYVKLLQKRGRSDLESNS